MFDVTTTVLAAIGVLFIGFSKAGFGGGLGMLTTPICVLAFSASGKGPVFAIGILLPLLCAGDAFSIYHYWGKWERKNLKYLLPGVVAGDYWSAFNWKIFQSSIQPGHRSAGRILCALSVGEG
jgi:uncharacterized membrane protein YfcA